ncbi:hypothetical protein SDC9_60539 [bioreactor metagenome]|uniref:HD domain-containing protein n=1 Tax=bioreactor metagenome TaxID=1076179 RepID=A0A644XDK6_9ZZZZ
MSWIKNDDIRKFAEKLISCAPEYFWTVPSSSTGKYHAEYALGPGGLVRHSIACVMIAHELLGLDMYGKFTQEEKDMMLTALMAHDFFKHGLEERAGKFTVAEHPTVCANYIKSNEELCAMLPEEQIDFICGCIASHMGQYNTDYKTKKEILPKPKTAAQKFTHQCDIIASRRYLIFDFGDNYYNPESEKPPIEVEPQVDELTPLLSDIVTICKSKIDAGVNRNTVYQVIKENNNGNRNPNSISDIEVAKTVKRKLEELNVA